MTAVTTTAAAPAGGTVEQQTAASLARRLGNALAADGDPNAAELYDNMLIDAVDAARSHGLPLAVIVAALHAEADARGWR